MNIELIPQFLNNNSFSKEIKETIYFESLYVLYNVLKEYKSSLYIRYKKPE